jgi:polygalacturonase
MSTWSRRRFVLSTAAAAPAILIPRSFEAFQRGPSPDPWARAAAILKRVVAPRFPSRDFAITDYGAVGDGQANCTDAIHKTIATCRAAGGGRVVIPDGRFLTAAIKLESGVNLHLSPKATLAFSGDSREYPLVLTRWEGTELMNHSPFIYAFEAEDIAITGSGTLDGQADSDHWWN